MPQFIYLASLALYLKSTLCLQVLPVVPAAEQSQSQTSKGWIQEPPHGFTRCKRHSSPASPRPITNAFSCFLRSEGRVFSRQKLRLHPRDPRMTPQQVCFLSEGVCGVRHAAARVAGKSLLPKIICKFSEQLPVLFFKNDIY